MENALNFLTRLRLKIAVAFWRLLLGECVKWGADVSLYEGIKLAVQPGARLTLSDRVSLQKGAVISLAAGTEAFLGEGVYLGEYSVVMVKQSIKIGPRSMIGPHCVFADYGHAFESASEVMTPDKVLCKPIQVEENVWVGAGAKILAGVTLGKGSVIGAGSVVTRDVPPFAVVAGAPAKVLRTRENSPVSQSISLPNVF